MNNTRMIFDLESKKENQTEDELTNQIIQLATSYGRYGVRRITAMLNKLGYDVSHKRVERIWRENGHKVPKKQPKRSRLWLNDGSCIRLRPEYRNHVWSYDFVTDQLINQKKIRWLNIIDEYSRVCIFCEPGSTGPITTLWMSWRTASSFTGSPLICAVITDRSLSPKNWSSGLSD